MTPIFVSFDKARSAPSPPLDQRPLIAIQARMGSTRLPGKVMARLGRQTVLEWVIARARAASNHQGAVILTSKSENDRPIAELATRLGVECFRGSEKDVLSRYVELVQKKRPPAVVRVTADCPLVDPQVIDAIVKAWWNQGKKVEYASNTLERTFPDGLDIEVLSAETLIELDSLAEREHREHVTSYIVSHREDFECVSVQLDADWSSIRVTLDTAEDLQRLRDLVGEAIHPLDGPRLDDIIARLGCSRSSGGLG